MALLIGFSGQGRQYSGMFHLLQADEFGAAWLNEASHLLNSNLLDEQNVGKHCNDVLYSQLFNVVLSVGAFRGLQRQAAFHSLLCGYSLGEVAAFCASTEMPLEKICQLIEMRAILMQNAMNEATHHQPAGLAVLKGNLNLTTAQELADQFQCSIAIIINEDHYVIGGVDDKINLLIKKAQSKGILKTIKLAVKLPSHTPLLETATNKFLSYLEDQFTNYPLKFTILNALTIEIISSTQEILPILANELSQTLRWDKLMRIATEYGVASFFELGPESDLKKMFTSVNTEIKAYALDDFSTLHGMRKLIG